MRLILTIVAVVAVLVFPNTVCYADCGGTATAASCSGSAATASCGGVTVLRRAPIRSALLRVRERIALRPRFAVVSVAGCGGQAAVASCSGQTAVNSCGGQADVARVRLVRPIALVRPIIEAVVPAASCPGGVCPIEAGRVAPVRNSLYAIALASAQYRAARGIHGHSPIDMQHTSGVGYASHDSTPMTCLGDSGPTYASVRGRDGFYATLIR